MQTWNLLQFEEPFTSIIKGLQCFDFLGDGYIARIDFKKVLEEFKFPVQATELENFMTRYNIFYFAISSKLKAKIDFSKQHLCNNFAITLTSMLILFEISHTLQPSMFQDWDQNSPRPGCIQRSVRKILEKVRRRASAQNSPQWSSCVSIVMLNYSKSLVLTLLECDIHLL